MTTIFLAQPTVVAIELDLDSQPEKAMSKSLTEELKEAVLRQVGAVLCTHFSRKKQ